MHQNGKNYGAWYVCIQYVCSICSICMWGKVGERKKSERILKNTTSCFSKILQTPRKLPQKTFISFTPLTSTVRDYQYIVLCSICSMYVCMYIYSMYVVYVCVCKCSILVQISISKRKSEGREKVKQLLFVRIGNVGILYLKTPTTKQSNVCSVRRHQLKKK